FRRRPGEARRRSRGPPPHGTRDPGRAGEDFAGDSRRAAAVAGRMTTPVAGGLAQELAATVDELRRMTVQVRTGGAASGAGVLWSAGGSENGGLIITNAHVVRGNRAAMRLAPGFSGGPLADTTGRLVGVNTMMQGGLALAVPAAAVEAWVRRAHALAAP